MKRSSIPPKRHRYRCEGIPGLEVAAAEWSPPPPPDPTSQGWLPLDGAVLGPLFDQSDTDP